MSTVPFYTVALTFVLRKSYQMMHQPWLGSANFKFYGISLYGANPIPSNPQTPRRQKKNTPQPPKTKNQTPNPQPSILDPKPQTLNPEAGGGAFIASLLSIVEGFAVEWRDSTADAILVSFAATLTFFGSGCRA